jgi:hypothetical protein
VNRVRAFGAFWYDFVVGDDWFIAVGVVIALGVTYALAATGIPAWWVPPAAVAVVLSASLARVVRTRRRDFPAAPARKGIHR